MNVTRIGLDLAKQVFQVHGVDGHDKPVIRKRLSRRGLMEFFAQLPPCLVAMEACAGAHHWARGLRELGHEVRLIDARFVVPYRKGNKNDGNDAEAICEAAGRPSMRFVPVKSVEQQAVLTVHRVRALLVGERTALVNHIRGLLGEFGLVIAQGRARVRQALPGLLEDADNGLPDLARELFYGLYERLLELERRIGELDQRIESLARESEPARRLMELPGIGPVSASALIATLGEARDFDNGRQLAAWLGLTPRQHSSAGKTRLGRITKRGDRYLRTLLVHGARSVLRGAGGRADATSRWASAVKQRRGSNKATVALAAKNARRVWAMLARAQSYQPQVPAPSGA
jgi:transposase